jgi:arylsulfatase A-like enzyme
MKKFLAGGLWMLVATVGMGWAVEPERPNIVVFLSDDMGWDQPGFQGGTKVATPSLDRLAREGVSLTQFYVQCVCSPTRAALMTGRYPFRNGMEERSHGLDVGGMLVDERTLAQAVREVGYATAIFGKWHLGGWYKQHLPRQRGFDYQYGLYGALIDCFSHRREEIFDWHRQEQLLDQPGYSTFLIADEFVRLLQVRDRGVPFFYYVPFNAVHSPHGAPQEYLDKHRDDPQAAMLECMDVAIGRMLGALEQQAILDQTLVIFLNDNGGPKRLTNGPYRGHKGDNYEGGIRVPCLWRWPRRLPAGNRCDQMLHVVDLYPTLVRLAGGTLDQPLPLDGFDVWPTIAEGKVSPRSELILSVPGLETSETGPPALRVGDYKLVGDELYHLANDPGETRDLASQMPERVASMKRRLERLAEERRTPEVHGRPPRVGAIVMGEQESLAPTPDWLQQENVERARNPVPSKKERRAESRRQMKSQPRGGPAKASR